MGSKQSFESPDQLAPIYRCPPGAQVAWIARKSDEIQRLHKGGAVQTASVPFMSRSDEILNSDARYPSFKCIESYRGSNSTYIPGENLYNKKAINR